MNSGLDTRVADRVALSLGGIAAFRKVYSSLKVPFFPIHTVEDPSAYVIALMAYAILNWVLFRVICLVVPKIAAAHPISLAVAVSAFFWAIVLAWKGQPNTSYIILFSIGSLAFAAVLYWLFASFRRLAGLLSTILISVAVALLIISALQAFVPSYRWDLFQNKESEKPNFILITLDTTRADHLSFYGYPVETSPFFVRSPSKEFFSKRVYFSHMDSSGARIVVQGRCHRFSGLGFKKFFSSPDATTLAEILKQQGYTTAGFIGGRFLYLHFISIRVSTITMNISTNTAS